METYSRREAVTIAVVGFAGCNSITDDTNTLSVASTSFPADTRTRYFTEQPPINSTDGLWSTVITNKENKNKKILNKKIPSGTESYLRANFDEQFIGIVAAPLPSNYDINIAESKIVDSELIVRVNKYGETEDDVSTRGERSESGGKFFKYVFTTYMKNGTTPKTASVSWADS